jgi:xylose isomerase
VDVSDIVYAHILGMDALARGLRNAAALKASGLLDGLLAARYASWHEKGGLGARIAGGKVRARCVVHAVCCWGGGVALLSR